MNAATNNQTPLPESTNSITPPPAFAPRLQSNSDKLRQAQSNSLFLKLESRPFPWSLPFAFNYPPPVEPTRCAAAARRWEPCGSARTPSSINHHPSSNSVQAQSNLESNQKIRPVKPGQGWSRLKF